MPISIIRTTALLIAAVVFPLRPAHADPVTITNGFAMTASFGSGPVEFSMSGDDFTAVGRWDGANTVPALTCDRGCAPGQILTLSTTLTNLIPQTEPDELVAAGSASINGINYPFVEFIGSLGFLTPSVTLPPITPGTEGLTLRTPFTFGGVMQGWDPLRRDAVLLFTQELTGMGTATLTMAPRSSSSYTFVGVRYDFAATPEPATLAYVFTGLIGVWLCHNRASRTQT